MGLCFYKSTSYAANQITYRRIDGSTRGLDGVKDSSSDADFTNAKAALAGETILAFMYEECRSAPNPSVASAGNMELVVVCASDVTDSGTGIGGNANAVWFIYNNKLYITGTTGVLGAKVTIHDSSALAGTAPMTMRFNGSTSEVYYPSFFYSDIDASGSSGIQSPTTGDEITYAANNYFTFKDTAVDTYEESTAARDDITINGVRIDVHASTGELYPQNVPWKNHFASITDIYISDDIELSGNMNGLFNASFTYIKETGDATNDMGDSVYTSLKNIYLYCDLDKVTGAAGMFARITNLENIYVRNGTPASTMSNAKSTAYMFYGDKKLVNGTDSFINVMDLSASINLESTSFMFGGCESISQPNVGSYYMAKVKWADGMFFGAKNMKLVCDATTPVGYNIYTWDLSSVVNASVMFSGGDADGSIDLDDPTSSMDAGIGDISEYGSVIVGTVDMSGWNMAAVETMYYMFSRNGENFTGIVFGANYPQLADASGMFLRCDYLRSATMSSSMPLLKNSTVMFKMAGSKASVASANLSNWTVPALKNADFMFYYSGFMSIDTTGISNLSNVVSAKGMFGECRKLQSLGNGALSTVTFGALQDASMMFINDEALVKVDTANWNMSALADAGFMFQNTKQLSAGLDVSNWGVTSALTDMECFADGNAMASFNLANWDSRFVRSFAFAFANNPNLTTVTMPTASNSLFTVTTMFGMFADDPALTSVSAFQKAGNLVDAGAMFANDIALTTADVKNLVGSNKCEYIDYFMKNCAVITNVDISGWNTAGIKYAQGAWDGCRSLSTLSTGSMLSGVALVDTGTMFRNCHSITNSSLSNVVGGLGSTANLVDCYEMLKNCYALTVLDLSGINLSGATNLTRLAAMEENAAFTTNKLTTIILPESILSAPGVALKDTDNTSINMFWVDGDGVADGSSEEDISTDDLLTNLFIAGTPNANILAYNFGGTNADNDNRTFIKSNNRTINGNGVGTYVLSGTDDKAKMAIDVTTSFYTGGTSSTTAKNQPAAYIWTNNNSNIAGATESSYETNKSGTYVATAYPSLLTGSNTKTSATFVIGKSITGIEAEYTGPSITVGNNYSLDNVTVKLVDTDGNKTPLTSTDYTVDSLTVSKSGTNTYTATYKSGTETYSAKFTVEGIRNIGSVEAKYNGPSVLVGKEYDTSYVALTAYYADDTDKKEGFSVTPTSFSALNVSKPGDNTFTASYEDKTQNKTFTADFVVNGYKQISSIAATYTGDKIKVGEKYSTDDVKVTLYYADGSGSDTTRNFTVDSQTVTYEGGNSFKASYRDPYGNIYSAGFNVPGYREQQQSQTTTTPQPEQPSNVVTQSSVSAPIDASALATNSSSGNSGAVKQGTSTGVVQTGRTLKLTLYILAMIALAALLVILIVIRRKQGRR